jgi:hypothetical protein
VTGGAGSGTVSKTITWTSTTDIIGITAFNSDNNHPNANILLAGLNVIPTPEPSTLAFMSLGLLGLLGLDRKPIRN